MSTSDYDLMRAAQDERDKAREQARILREALQPVAVFRIPGKRDLDNGAVRDEMHIMIRNARRAIDATEPKP